jgi:hypothetical protein
MGLHRSISDHGVFICKQESSERFIALATDDCLIMCDDRAQFLDLKSKMEAMFDLTLQQVAILHFLNLRIIQSPAGISIDQTDHIVKTIVEPYFKYRNTSALISITSPFLPDSSFEQRLYEAPILVGPALHVVETKYGGSLFHWSGFLLHVTLNTHLDIGYAIM